MIFLGGVEQEVHHAVHIAVGRNRTTHVHAQPARHGRSDLGSGQHFPFDLAAPYHVLGQSAKEGFPAHFKPEGFHLSHEPSLQESDRGQLGGQRISVPAEFRPFRGLVYVYSTLHVRLF